MTRLLAALFLLMFAAPVLAVDGPGNIRLDSKVSSMKKAGLGPVTYPHKLHEKLYKCDACHPKIFKDKHGDNDINMKQNMNQKFCGSTSCHNSDKAFPLYMCDKCHEVIKKGAAKK